MGCTEERMNLWRRRGFIAQAIAWRLEQEAVLSAEVQILEALLRATREDLAEVRNLHDRELLARFGWESPARFAEIMRERQEFLDECADIWVEGDFSLEHYSVVV
jgi:hypothetical protein